VLYYLAELFNIRRENTMVIILIITTGKQWEQAKKMGAYRGDTLDTEGFIHCSTPRQVIGVANSLFKAQRGLVLLCIESDRVKAEIRYEGTKEHYPHIYGPLNIDAVTKVVDFEPNQDGRFHLPKDIDVIG
jgi:uncharacterized protein (DUF952 family)